MLRSLLAHIVTQWGPCPVATNCWNELNSLGSNWMDITTDLMRTAKEQTAFLQQSLHFKNIADSWNFTWLTTKSTILVIGQHQFGVIGTFSYLCAFLDINAFLIFTTLEIFFRWKIQGLMEYLYLVIMFRKIQLHDSAELAELRPNDLKTPFVSPQCHTLKDWQNSLENI